MRQNHPSFLASAEDEIQRGSAIYSRSHRLLSKGQNQNPGFPSHEAMVGGARCPSQGSSPHRAVKTEPAARLGLGQARGFSVHGYGPRAQAEDTLFYPARRQH